MKFTNNNYFTELKNIIPNKLLKDNFANSDNEPSQANKDLYNKVYVTKNGAGSELPKDSSVGQGYMFPPSGGWEAGSEFNPAISTPEGSVGLTNEIAGPENEDDFDEKKFGWICAIEEDGFPIAKNNYEINPKNLDKAKVNYAKIRSGEKKIKLKADFQSKNGNSYVIGDDLISILSDSTSLYCDPSVKTSPQMGGSSSLVSPTKDTPGYELGCTSGAGEIVPNCACDPNCFPGVLGGWDKENKECYPLSQCSYPDGILFKTNDSRGTPQCNTESQRQLNIDGNNYGAFGNGYPCLDTEGNVIQINGIVQYPNPSCPSPKNKDLGDMCPRPSFDETLPDQNEKIAKAMGMSTTCSKVAKTTAASGQFSSKSFGVSKGGLTGIGVAGNMTNGSFTRTTSNNSSVGCGQRILNSIEQSQNIANIQCNLNKAEAESTVQIGTNSTIEIKIGKKSELDLKLELKQQETFNKLAASIPNVKPLKAQERILKILENMEAKINKTSDIKNNTFTNLTNIKAQAITKTTVKSAADIVVDTITSITAVAQQELEVEMGVDALDPNTNQIISNKISNNLENITTSINQALSSSSVSAGSNSRISISVPYGTSITENTFLNDTTIDLTAISTASIANKMGVEIASEIILDATNASKTKTVSKGLEEVIKELGIANQKAIIASQTTSIIMWIAIVIVIGILGFFIFRSAASSSDGGKGPSVTTNK